MYYNLMITFPLQQPEVPHLPEGDLIWWLEKKRCTKKELTSPIKQRACNTEDETGAGKLPDMGGEGLFIPMQKLAPSDNGMGWEWTAQPHNRHRYTHTHTA